jgi:glutathione synthase/RimK-type ligase-like ATP-grasp enzyme
MKAINLSQTEAFPKIVLHFSCISNLVKNVIVQHFLREGHRRIKRYVILGSSVV